MLRHITKVGHALVLLAIVLAATCGCQMTRSIHALPATKETIPNITGWWADADDEDQTPVWLEPETDEQGFVHIVMRYVDEMAPPSREDVLARRSLATYATILTVHPVSRGYIVQITPDLSRAEELFEGPHALNMMLVMPLAMHSHVEPADEACSRLTMRSLRSAWVAKEVEVGRTNGEVQHGQFDTVSVLIFDQPDDQMAMFERALKDEANAWGEPTEMVKLSDEEVGKRYDAWRARLKLEQGE